jgi:TetR/AcrR family transcriptional regulator, cholesterol catabolism regulator
MPRNNRELDSEQKREAIVSAARRLFVTEGYEATGMARIAAEAGVAPNTLYWYFDDKDALLIATLDGLVGEARAELAKVRAKSLHTKMMWMMERIDRLPDLVATVHARVSVSEAVRGWHDRFHRTLEAMVAEELARGGMPRAEQAIAARVAMFVVEGLLSHYAGDPSQREATVRFVTKVFAGRASAPRKGT